MKDANGATERGVVRERRKQRQVATNASSQVCPMTTDRTPRQCVLTMAMVEHDAAPICIVMVLERYWIRHDGAIIGY